MSDDVKAAIHPHDAVVHRFLQHYGMPSRAHAAAVLNAAVAAGMMPPAEVERLREALRFYADESTYDVTTIVAWDDGAPLYEPECPIYDDRGEVARAALDGDPACNCGHCVDVLHDSDCAVHNEPAYPAGPCDCGVE